MNNPARAASALTISAVMIATLWPHDTRAQEDQDGWDTGAHYDASYGWEKLPDGMKLGTVSGVIPDPDGGHIWILSRCGANICAGVDQDPIMKFDLEGNLVDSFGGGLTAWPHGFWLDDDGYVWVTEGAPQGDRRGEVGEALGMGHQVLKFNQQGEIVMRLGVAGEPGDDTEHFNGPAGVAVDRNGDIWVVDGHRDGNNRMMRFAPDGTFKQQWGGGIDSASDAPGLFFDPHHIAFDSMGRIFVSDRGNNRLQLFDAEGNFLAIWKQFGRPSGVYIDPNDKIYVADGMSNEARNPGWQMALRIGDAKTGEVQIEMLDNYEYESNQSGIEFLAADRYGNVLAGEVTRQRLVRFEPLD
jgi:hypothetical protein